MPNSELFLGNLLLLVLVIIEILVIKFYLKENLPWRELILNLNSGHILLWIFRGLEVSMYFYTAKYISLNWVEHLPYWGFGYWRLYYGIFSFIGSTDCTISIHFFGVCMSSIMKENTLAFPWESEIHGILL